MSPRRLPPAIAAALENVRAATDDLVRAASDENAEAILDAVGRRADAMRRLEPLVLAARKEPGRPYDDALVRAADVLAGRAREAGSALEATRATAARGLEAVEKGARVVRSYVSAGSEAVALDTSR